MHMTTTLNDMEQALQAAGPEPAPSQARAGQQARRSVVLPGWGELTVTLRTRHQGQRQFVYELAGLRMERPTLLHLLCTDPHCPQAQRVKASWAQRKAKTPGPWPNRAMGAPVSRPSGAAAGPRNAGAPARPRGLAWRPLQVQALMQEVPLDVAGHACAARPAQWTCRRACPQQAHPAYTVVLPGWDLFEHGHWLAGGCVDDVREGVCQQRPRFETLEDARGWVLAQHGAAAAVLHGLR